jgi:hypothetical protein
LKLEVYEYTREIATAPEIGYLSNLEIDCFDQIKFCNGNSIQSLKNHKPEIRIEREFNIAKKKELDVKPLNGNEKYKLNKARLEFLVDLALEENNKEDFIKFSNKLKKYYRQEVEL